MGLKVDGGNLAPLEKFSNSMQLPLLMLTRVAQTSPHPQ